MSDLSALFPSDRWVEKGAALPPVIAPALLGAPSLALGEAARACVEGGADVLHVDVMDGRFGPYTTFGAAVIRSLKKELGDAIPLDVHLLVDDVDDHVEAYLDAGADILTIPLETSRNPYKSLETIREAGRRTGVAILPATPEGALDELLPLIDLVLVMTVHPGESRFLEPVVPKIDRLRRASASRNLPFRIGVDGGVKEPTLPTMAAAGAEWIVAGSAVFGGGTIAANVSRLRAIVEEGGR